MQEFFAFAIGAAFGSVPFAVIFSQLFAHKDIRTQGSKNPGTTNVIRVAGFLPGALTFIFDCAKTVVAVLISQKLFGQSAAIFAGIGVTIGHDFSPFLKFRGGKGVAAAIAFAAVTDWCMLLALVPAAVSAVITKRMAVGSVALACVLPFSSALFGLSYGYTAAFSLLGVIMLIRHRSNFNISGEKKIEKEII